jgi:hypothetical protein
VKRLAWLLIALCCALEDFGQATITQLLNNGPTASRVNIVFLSEGFTAGQLGSYLTQANNLLNAFLAAAPYNEYKTYFNAFAISVASAESGSDHPSTGVYKNTYFNSSFESYGIDRLLTIPPNSFDTTYSDGQGKVDALLASLMPEYDIVMMIVNDTVYGGSGGSTAIASINTSSKEIVIHETGHSFGLLGDEYGDPYPGFPDTEEPNTTTQTDRDLIKWNAWINSSTPIPTPTTYTTQIGLFEGAHYHFTGWFRPKYNCRMRTLGIPFCAVCAESLVRTIYGRISPIESFAPATNVIYAITNAQTVTLSVAPMRPVTHALSVKWLINGVEVPGATGTSFTADTASLSNGSNTVTAAVSDATPFVRTDPLGVLQDERAWTINATVAPPQLDARLGNGVILSWPTNAPNYHLESSSDLATWGLSGTSRSVNGSNYEVTVPADGAELFFRLRSN